METRSQHAARRGSPRGGRPDASASEDESRPTQRSRSGTPKGKSTARRGRRGAAESAESAGESPPAASKRSGSTKKKRGIAADEMELASQAGLRPGESGAVLDPPLCKRVMIICFGPIPILFAIAAVLNNIAPEHQTREDPVGLGIIVFKLVALIILGVSASRQATSEAAVDEEGDAGLRKKVAAEKVMACALLPGQLCRLRPGSFVPADGKILNSNSKDAWVEVDESVVTGEAIGARRRKQVNDQVLAGSVVMDGELTMEVTHVQSETTFGRNDAKKRSKALRLIRFIALVTTTMAFLGALVCIVVPMGSQQHHKIYDSVYFLLLLVVAMIPVTVPLFTVSGPLITACLCSCVLFYIGLAVLVAYFFVLPKLSAVMELQATPLGSPTRRIPAL
eukprot:GHVU01036543.1.p2 GENE.GHVU01036543.1~~GHVU01036543.1.p2  ORF type:complete len:394 (-),score=81.19 GHVU01036543.1:1878-3059(-)